MSHKFKSNSFITEFTVCLNRWSRSEVISFFLFLKLELSGCGGDIWYWHLLSTPDAVKDKMTTEKKQTQAYKVLLYVTTVSHLITTWCLEDNLEGTAHNSHLQFCKCWNLIKPFLQPTEYTRSWHMQGVSVILHPLAHTISQFLFLEPVSVSEISVCVCVGQLPLQCLQTIHVGWIIECIHCCTG